MEKNFYNINGQDIASVSSMLLPKRRPGQIKKKIRAVKIAVVSRTLLKQENHSTNVFYCIIVSISLEKFI